MSLNTGAASVVANYTYDGFQKLRLQNADIPRRHDATLSGTSFGHIIAEHNGTSGALTRDYIWLGDTPLAVNEGATLSYVHPDHLDLPYRHDRLQAARQWHGRRNTTRSAMR